MADSTITIKDANGVDRVMAVVLNGGVYTFKQTLVTSDGSPMEDSTTQSLRTITDAHHHIHAGERYVVQEGIQLNSGSKNYLITTPNTTSWAHMTIDVEGGMDTQIVFVEGSTHTGGTVMPPRNRNRNTGDGAGGVIVAHTPGGVAGAPTEIFSCQFGIPTSGGGRGGGGGTQQGRSEFILKQNTKYLLTVTALSANDNNICVSIDWYNHINS